MIIRQNNFYSFGKGAPNEFQVVAFLSFQACFDTTFLTIYGRGHGLRTTTFLKTVVASNQGHALFGNICSGQSSLLWQSNVKVLMRLSQIAVVVVMVAVVEIVAVKLGDSCSSGGRSCGGGDDGGSSENPCI